MSATTTPVMGMGRLCRLSAQGQGPKILNVTGPKLRAHCNLKPYLVAQWYPLPFFGYGFPYKVTNPQKGCTY